MNSEPKPFASLSSGLLARKGAARPAMRPQGFGGQTGGGLDDLGWNDMGFEPPRPAAVPILDSEHDGFGEELSEQPLRNPLAALTPVHSPVHSQQAEIADRLAPVGDEPDEDEIDETAELYEPDAVDQPEPELEREPVPFVAEVPQLELPSAPLLQTKPAGPDRSAVASRPAKPRSVPGTKDKAAFTLRLDQTRHLKLRLACAISGRSAQLIVTDALDALLAAMPELDAMAEKANRKG